MHKLLENYLSDVEASLSPLPTSRRNEELREIRSHLLNAVIVSQEMGQSKDEAVKTAIEQFGEPTEFAQGAVRAWQRGERKTNTRSFWGAIICAGLLMQLLMFFGSWIFKLYFKPDFEAQHSQQYLSILTVAWIVCNTASTLLVGAITGLAFPKQAIKGACAAVIIKIALQSISLVVLYNHKPEIHMPALTLATESLFVLAIGLSEASLSAWAASRWRLSKFARN